LGWLRFIVFRSESNRRSLLILERDPRADRLLSTLHVNWPPAKHDDDLQATFDRNDEEINNLSEQRQKIPIVHLNAADRILA
jgi:hypothetical protein